jgi:hypothetical protein
MLRKSKRINGYGTTGPTIAIYAIIVFVAFAGSAEAVVSAVFEEMLVNSRSPAFLNEQQITSVTMSTYNYGSTLSFYVRISNCNN